MYNIFLAESYGEAAVLGEQFHDFATLLKLYELDGNDAKLAGYLDLPKFAEFIYKKVNFLICVFWRKTSFESKT